MERIGASNKARKPGGLTSMTFPNIEWIIANHGSITIGDVGASVGCVAAAADQRMCYAMLAQREGENLLTLMSRLDKAIATASQTSETIDEVNPPDGFKPRKQAKSRRP